MTDVLSLLPLPTTEARRSYSSRRKWERHEYRERQIEAQRKSHPPEHMKMMQELAKTPEAIAKKSESTARSWKGPARQKRMSYWTPENRKAQARRAAEMHKRRKAA